jgi:16S rRNA (guanine527-N7)-methyltransferase
MGMKWFLCGVVTPASRQAGVPSLKTGSDAAATEGVRARAREDAHRTRAGPSLAVRNPMIEGTDPRLSALVSIAGQLGLGLPLEASARLLRYLDLLQQWNATYNLTAVRDPSDMLTQHLADCLAVIGPLRQAMGTIAIPRILDVGSGGGLPGVVIAALHPDWEVVCVDTVGKKAAFIQQAALELTLPKLRAVHARVEKLADGSFDLVTSRAFASLSDFVRLTRHLLRRGGVWMAMKGKRSDDELSALPADIEVFHVEQLTVPGMQAERCLVWMRPKDS